MQLQPKVHLFKQAVSCKKNCMGQLGFTKKLCSDQHCCYPGTVCLLWQAKKMPVCPVHTTIIKHLHHGICRRQNVCEIKFIEMCHYVNLCNYSQASEPWLVDSQDLNDLFSLCLHLSSPTLILSTSFICIQMCIISPTYGYDLEGLICASVTDS